MANTQYITKNSFIIKARKDRFLVGIIWAKILLIMLLILPLIVDEYISHSLAILIVTNVYFLSKVRSAGHQNRVSGKAELNLYKHLKKLPENYVIYNQVEIPSDKGSWGFFELDYILISPSSQIYIIESKYYSGKVVGSNSGTWKSIKYSKSGFEYEREQKNPIYQLGYQKEILIDFIIQFNLKVTINCIVYLDKLQKDSQLPEKPRYPIFSDKKIIKYIRENEKKYVKIHGINKRTENYFNLVEIFRLIKNKTIT